MSAIRAEDLTARVSDHLARAGYEPRLERSGFSARCPVCQERSRSLALSRDEGGAVVKCRSGCAEGAILKKIGLRPEEVRIPVDGTAGAPRSSRPARQGKKRTAPPADNEPGQHSGQEVPNESKSVVLVELATSLPLLHDAGSTPYAVLPLPGGGRRTVPLQHAAFRTWLSTAYFRKTGGKMAASPESIATAIGILTGKALEGPCAEVHVRVAEANGAIYIDLANDAGEAVEITADGWKVIQDAPVNFRRERGTLPLPRPEPGGSVELIRDLVNAPGDNEWRLLVAWLVAALRPGRPFPVLVLQGEQGCAKSTTGRLLRALIDPAKPSDRARPRDDRELNIAARNSWVLAYDNVSGFPDWLSDALCRISTGSGHAARKLYSDNEEEIFDSCRPVMANGIDELLNRPDLADRALRVTLPVIPEERRRSMDEVNSAFEAHRPRVLGALYSAVSQALRTLPQVTREARNLPRMADFALWVISAESALGWAPGDFMRAYRGNRAELVEQSLEAEPVAVAVRELVAAQGEAGWTGAAGELLAELERLWGESPPHGAPEGAKALSNRLRRIAPNLRAVGVEVEGPVRTGRDRTRLYKLHSTVRTVRTVRAPSDGVGASAGGADDAADGRGQAAGGPPSAADGADGADGGSPLRTQVRRWGGRRHDQ